jgi:hypothetical protein
LIASPVAGLCPPQAFLLTRKSFPIPGRMLKDDYAPTLQQAFDYDFLGKGEIISSQYFI